MSDLEFNRHDPGGGRLTDLVTGASIDLSSEQITWLTLTLTAATSVTPSPPTSVDDALDALSEDCDNCTLSEK